MRTNEIIIEEIEKLLAELKARNVEVAPKSSRLKTLMEVNSASLQSEDIRKQLEKENCKVSNWANDILSKIAIPKNETTLDLVTVTVSELGFENGATREDIYKRAQELGLSLCPAWVGPALRLAYKNQPVDEWLLIGMKPVVDSDECPDVFRVGHGSGGLWLNARCGYPSYVWNPEGRWVFVRTK